VASLSLDEKKLFDVQSRGTTEPRKAISVLARPCTYKSVAVTQRRPRPLRPVSDQARAAAQHVAKGHKPKRNRAEVKENQSECVEWTCRMTMYGRTDTALSRQIATTNGVDQDQ
jgi:hypothetical protein